MSGPKTRVTDTRGLSDWSTDEPADGQTPVWDEAAGEYAPGTISVAASGERLVQDGTSPPVDLTLEDESDYLYEDV